MERKESFDRARLGFVQMETTTGNKSEQQEALEEEKADQEAEAMTNGMHFTIYIKKYILL